MEQNKDIQFFAHIVDIDVLLSNMIGSFFEKKGIAVDLRDDLDLAVEHLYKDKINIVLFDYSIYIDDQYQRLVNLKGSGIPVAFIIMTGFSKIEESLKLVGGLAYDYIIKPFRLQELSIIIQKLSCLYGLKETINRKNEELQLLKEENILLRQKIKELSKMSIEHDIKLKEQLINEGATDQEVHASKAGKTKFDQQHQNPQVLVYKKNEMLQDILNKIKEITGKVK